MGIALVIAAFSIYHHFSKDLPKLDSLKDYSPPVISEVFSDNGTKIGEYWTEKRLLLQPKELPKVMIQAVIASEDDRFYEHGGIDPLGILRALFENIKAGHVVQGGSTITQQVTKGLLLSRERTLDRKIKEAILATRIEKRLSKEEILYLYLNQVYFGNRAYGVEAAALNYFHKTSKELNVAEAAIIAGLAKAPSIYSPLKDFKRSKLRQEYVIDRMQNEAFITKEQAVHAKQFPLKIYSAPTDKEFNLKYAPWFTEYVRLLIQKKYGEQVPYTHGLKVYTTLDLPMQKAADNAVRMGLRELDRRQGYSGPIQHILEENYREFNQQNHQKIVADFFVDQEMTHFKDDIKKTPLRKSQLYQGLITQVDSKGERLKVQVGHEKGEILVHDYAWARKRNLNGVGYNDVYYIRDPSSTFHEGDVVWVSVKDDPNYFSLEQVPEAEAALFSYEPGTGFVRAIVGGKDFSKSEFNRAMIAMRQTGSAIKPLIYSAALDKGFTPDTLIEDSPIFYEYSPGRFWSPQNYGGEFKGPTSFRSGLVNSRNVVTVKILMDIGVDYATAYMRKLGITSPIQRYYAMALGSNDMKLYELCQAYGTFVTGGVVPELVYIKRIIDRFGQVLEEHQPKNIVPFLEQIKDREAVEPSRELNQALYEKSKSWIDSEKLELTEEEKISLFGSHIPEGYAISPRTAYTMVKLFQDIVNFGTGYKVKELKRPAGGKTGTTNDETDTWFVGFVPDLLAGVWVGFDQVKKIGGKETGGKTAAPIFTYFMKEALENTEVAQFIIPEGINLPALDAPIQMTAGGDAESGGVPRSGSSADFFIHDF